MGRPRSTIASTTRSFALKQLDFNLRIHFKYIAYAVEVNDAAELRKRVESNAVNYVTFLEFLSPCDSL